jgi:hypothetical protein
VKPPAYFRRKLPHVIEPTGGPGVELVTLKDCAKFMGLVRPWRQAPPHWDCAASRGAYNNNGGALHDWTARVAGQLDRSQFEFDFVFDQPNAGDARCCQF